MTKQCGKRLSLVLGSGGARGLAHIGVIRWLEEKKFEIASISGCSMGALIGGIYAAGKLDEYERWVSAITKMDILTLLDLSWQKSGLVKGDRIINTLTELVGDVEIDDLPITFTAVATDIANEKEVWINSGKLFDAIRASISMPLFFTPFRRRGVELIDGGVLNPVPIAPTFGDDTDFTLAVNVSGKVDPVAESEVSPTHFRFVEDKSLTRKIGAFLNSLVESDDERSRDRGAYEIAHLAFDAMQGAISRQKLSAYPPDYTIEIERNACSVLEFFRAREMIELGYARAEEALAGKLL